MVERWWYLVRDGGAAVLVYLSMILLVLVAPLSAWGGTGEVLYDGEPGQAPLLDTSCGHYAHETTSVAHSGRRSLELTPTPWHRPALKLFCGGGSRRNFKPWDVIEFFMRAADPAHPPKAPLFHVTTWHGSSHTVPILDYIDGGVLDGRWRRVQIPISALKTGSWDVSDVEFLQWSQDKERRRSYVDDIVLRDIRPVEIQAIIVKNHQYLRLRFSEPLVVDNARQPTRYSLRSTMDTTYAQPQHPTALGYEVRVVDFGGTQPQGDSEAPVLRIDMTLRLPAPLQPHMTYTLTVDGLTDKAGNVMKEVNIPVVFDPKRHNPHIKVNQVGYLPNSPKWGYVGAYVGDLGGGLWSVGDAGMIRRWTPTTGWLASPVTPQTPEPRLRAVYALTASDVWVVGAAGAVFHWDGATWQAVTVPTAADLSAISFTARAEGWIVGKDGTVLYKAAAEKTWRIVPSGTDVMLRDVFAVNAHEAWAVGDAGTLLRWDGTTWTALPVLTTATLHAVGGFPGSSVWAVGAGGTILRYRWGTWHTMASPTTATLRDVVGGIDGGALAVGDGGMILRKTGFDESPFVVEPSPGNTDLTAIAWLDNRLQSAVGRKGTAYRFDFATRTWVKDEMPAGAVTLHGVATLPAGSLRVYDQLSLPMSETDVTLVHEETGKTALTVPLVLREANWHLAGEDVYAFDFHALKTPGRYRAHVPGFGVSDAFVIAEDVYRDAARIAARGLYHQRCGTALTMTQHPHAICHLQEAQYHASNRNAPLYDGEPVGVGKDVRGGWHDAGDYNKYVTTGATALWYLLTSFELAERMPGGNSQERFGDQWGIPESGNGVPDVLDEAHWELDWLVRLQEEDGGVPHKVTTACWFAGMPEESIEPQYILAKTTHGTAMAAAVLALGSRLWQPYDADRAATYLAHAQRAWQFLEAHTQAEPSKGYANPPEICTGEYPDPQGDIDERAWAAAELYRTTGKVKYHTAFATLWTTHKPFWGWNEWQQHQRKASWAYVNTTWPDVNAAWKDTIVAAFVRAADTLAERTHAAPYHNGARLDVPTWIGWGRFAQSTAYTFRLLQTYALTNESRYWQSALLNLNTQLGANPLGLSFITGVGARYPMDPLHKPSMYDGIAEPVPGLPVFGPMAVLSKNNPYYKAVQDEAYSFPPAANEYDPYPILRRYVDTNEVVPHSEFTIVDMARTAGVLGLVSCVAESGTCPNRSVRERDSAQY